MTKILKYYINKQVSPMNTIAKEYNYNHINFIFQSIGNSDAYNEMCDTRFFLVMWLHVNSKT